MTKNQNNYEAYLFGPLIFAGNKYADAVLKTKDPLKIQLINSGQQGLQPALKVRRFLCSLCEKDYEKCPHDAYQKYDDAVCEPLISESEVLYASIVPRPNDPRTRITDILLAIKNEGKRQYVWYGYSVDSENVRLRHIDKARSRGWISKTAKDHLSKIFHIALDGIATYPPNPEFILKQGYRIDWIQDVEDMTDKELKILQARDKNGVYIKMRYKFDPERYDTLMIDDIEYLYDRFDKVLIPHKETMEFFMRNMKGSIFYWIRPKIDNITSYIDTRLSDIEELLSGKKDLPYKFVDVSEDFLSKLENQYVAKFVIVSIDIKGSTKISQDLPLKDNAAIVRVFSQEMARIVSNYHRFVLKYMGDGLVAYFPIPTFWGMDDNALDCSVTMKYMIENGINPIFQKRRLPRLKFRIGIDSGEA
ncbi:MAG TPA: adenylate/guanylate cyclase domain-containing protein, partial [Nitrososphaeraceae archaeon]|nr:adenylate/guanylate cyclase domain-containing protein [Nitrososphaeraceae archaeon]